MMNVGTFAEMVGGEVVGDSRREITGVASIADAGDGDITFVASAQYLPKLAGSRAACVLVKDVVPGLPMPQIRVSNPHYAFAKALELFYPLEAPAPGVSSRAVIAESASVSSAASVMDFVHVGEGAAVGGGSVIMPGVFVGAGSTIGENCTVYPNVTIREGVTIGHRVTIHAGSVIGSDGFGYVLEQGRHYKIPQVGRVVIEDDVEIGSNVSIDRATIGATIIRAGAKIDNLVQIAHNVTIGRNALIVSQVGIAGSTDIGDFAVIGGQAGIADHTTIAPGTMIAAQSGLKGRVEKGIYAGSPAIPHAVWLRAQALYGRLPELNRRLRELEEKITRLEKGETP